MKKFSVLMNGCMRLEGWVEVEALTREEAIGKAPAAADTDQMMWDSVGKKGTVEIAVADPILVQEMN